MSFARTRLFQSESFRHAALYAALFAVSMIALIALVYVTMNRSFEASLLRASNDDLLSIHKAYVSGLPRKKGIHEAKEMIDDRMLAPDPADRFLLQSGSDLRLAGNMQAMTPRIGVFHLYSYASDGRHDVIGRGDFVSPNLYAFVGRDTFEAKETEEQVLRDFALIFVCSILLASLTGLMLARNFLRRIDTISDTCGSIMAGRLGERIPVGKGKTELERLADTINGMLNRIQALMESLKQVSNDIAHDMRTPLAHLRFSLERGRNNSRTQEEYAATIEAAISSSDQLLDIFAALLRIAEIEAGARRQAFQDIDLQQQLRRIYDIYRPAMDDSDHPFELDAREAAFVQGDPQLLLQMISNLLDNAINYTPAGSAVNLRLLAGNQDIMIEVADKGSGIPPEDREKIFRRFYRGEESRTSSGSGLGLALVSVIAELHGAQIEVLDNRPGARFLIRFSKKPNSVAANPVHNLTSPQSFFSAASSI